MAAQGAEAGAVAVHVPADADGVVDSTGCGNAFLGAFEGALVASGGDVVWAMCMASAAASIMGEYAGERCAILNFQRGSSDDFRALERRRRHKLR